jgi:hypothetical protein
VLIGPVATEARGHRSARQALAVFCFALAAANDQERQKKARDNPKNRLHHCSVHCLFSFFDLCCRFVLRVPRNLAEASLRIPTPGERLRANRR